MNRLTLLILMVLMSAGIAGARDRGVTFKHLTQDHGLSQNSVFSILQDSKGFMWFGTQDGLNKYDGYGFKVYRPDPGNPASLSENNVSALLEDRKGFLWIGTNGGGLNKFDREKETFTHYHGTNRADDPSSVISDFISVICEDRQGNIWIGTPAAGLDKFDPLAGTFVHHRHRPGDSNSLSSDFISALCEDDSGFLWIGTGGGGLNRLDPQDGTFVHYRANPTDPHGLASDNITGILEDHAGELWVGTNAGLHLLDRKTGIFIRYTSNPGEPGSLSHNNINCIYEDHSGTLWVGTTEGLNRFNRRTERFVRYRYDAGNPTGLNYDMIASLYEDRSGILWVGTAGGGVDKFDRQGSKFRTYKLEPDNPNSLSHNFVYSFCESSVRPGVLWIGTSGGGLNRMEGINGEMKCTVYRNDPDDPTSLSTDYTFCVLEDREGFVWVGTTGGGLNRLDPETGRFRRYYNIPGDPTSLGSNFVRALYQDRAGVLWLGTFGGGLNRMDTDAGTFTVYRTVPDNPGEQGSNRIRSIYEDRAGILWLGTDDFGLVKFDRRAGTFTRYSRHYDEPTSLGNNIIGCVHEDRAGSLWVGTLGGGLNLMDRENGTFQHFREKHGLPNDVVYGIIEDDTGCLWLSTNMGISKFDPRTRVFKNYNALDGLQGNEFNGGAFHKGRDGRIYFGGVRGFNVFYPEQITDNKNVPPVVFTDFRVFHKHASLDKHISCAREITLSHKDNVFSFEFVALDFTIPEKNRYAYMMEGFDEDWIHTTAEKRFASYTNLDPGEYIFRVKGSNNDGIWNEEGTSVKIIITPPLWKTWWFQIITVLLAAALVVFIYKMRMKDISHKMRLQTELQTAHYAQMSIMPQSDPEVPGFEVSGICVPANEVGGDFFDYIWLNEKKTKFGVAIGDVSGKAMKAAMTAVISDGILFSKAAESDSIKEIMTRVNRPIYLKTDKKMFTALCLVALDIQEKALTFTNAGLSHPLLKSGDAVTIIKGEGSKFPLGLFEDNVYQETSTPLKVNDVIVLFTDGILDAQNVDGEFYDYEILTGLLRRMDCEALSASGIKAAIIKNVRAFAAGTEQQDDMTVVVIKVTG
jgi:ligand-binding sensor domain-containing protein/serine phosphatase RsbU (regulator of sigma subunit)